MSKDPAFLFYPSDFLSGTMFFTDEQTGKYIRLLCEQHQNGHIPENHMLSVCLSLGSPVVKKFRKDAAGNYYNERMEEEIEKRNHFIETRRDNGLKGGRPLKANDKPNGLPNGEATEKLIENDNINENRIELLKKRETEFRQLVFECDPLKYSQEMLEKFCQYWTEPNRSGTKMRFELEKVFDIPRRLTTWASRDKDIKTNHGSNKPNHSGQLKNVNSQW